MSRDCDAIGCTTPTASGRFMCSRHWRLVPLDLQRTINARYRAGRSGFAFLSDLSYLKAAVDAIDGLAKAEGREGAGVNPYVRHLVIAARRQGLTMCTLCSRPVLPGQPHNGATKNHWDCEQALKEKVKAEVERIDEALSRCGNAIERLVGKDFGR